jgi:DNA polymerase V
MIFHIDANAFYAACERLFRPDLLDKPIAVLSNNDGIIIALNQECKNLGFHRGDVFFKVRDELARRHVTVFSSNYTLYADLSARLNVLYARHAPEVEIYSIDESFLYFPNLKESDLAEIGHDLYWQTRKEVGIPVSIGVAPSKTLAKMCNKLAKKRGGVCVWSALDQDAELAAYPVGDIWGIGNAKAELLSRNGVVSALDLKRYPLHLAKKHLTITGMRTVQELNGVPAIDRVERECHQNICSSKSFAEVVTELPGLESALAAYTQEAVKRMREEHTACRYVSVYLMTNPWSDVGEQYFNSATAELPMPSAFLPDILAVALGLLRRIYQSGFRYRKVMINLLGLEPDHSAQADLFDIDINREKNDALMIACDTVNERYGRGTLHLGIRSLVPDTGNGDTQTAWAMKRDYLSPEYTTRLSDIPRVR